MSFFEFSGVDWSREWRLPTFVVFLIGVVFWIEPPDRRTRRLGIHIGIATAVLVFAIRLVDQFPASGRDLRYLLWLAIQCGAMTVPTLWSVKHSLPTYRQNCKAIVAFLRRLRERVRTLRGNDAGRRRAISNERSPSVEGMADSRDKPHQS